jgi:hypothetical protein
MDGFVVSGQNKAGWARAIKDCVGDDFQQFLEVDSKMKVAPGELEKERRT